MVEVGSGEAGSEGSEEAGSGETEVVAEEQGSREETDEKKVDGRKRGA